MQDTTQGIQEKYRKPFQERYWDAALRWSDVTITVTIVVFLTATELIIYHIHGLEEDRLDYIV